jgi:hypothetical protein
MWNLSSNAFVQVWLTAQALLRVLYNTGTGGNGEASATDHSVDYVFDALQPQHWLAKELLRAAEVKTSACIDT